MLRGKDVTTALPDQSIRNGVVLVPEDRKLQGLVLDHSIAENIGYANLDTVSRRGVVTSGQLARFADTFITRFGVKGRGGQDAGELSGGKSAEGGARQMAGPPAAGRGA